MRMILLLALVAVLQTCGCATPARGGDLETLQEGDPRTSDRDAAANGWIRAVLAGDRDGILRFTAPDYRSSVKTELENEGSDLSKLLLTGPQSIRARFDRRPLRVSLLAHKDLQDHGKGTSACYYSGTEPAWPRRSEDLAKLVSGGGVVCFFMYESEGSWYVSLPHPDEGGDV